MKSQINYRLLFAITSLALAFSIGLNINIFKALGSGEIQSTGKLTYTNPETSETIVIDTADHEVLQSNIESNTDKINVIDQQNKDILNSCAGLITPGLNYSTDERIIGSWLNGKPIYQKTFQFTSPSIGETKEIDIENLNIDEVVSFNGLLNEIYDSYLPINLYISTDDYMNAWIDQKINIIFNVGHWAYENRPTVITIQYTKTTDEPNSFTPDMIEN